MLKIVDVEAQPSATIRASAVHLATSGEVQWELRWGGCIVGGYGCIKGSAKARWYHTPCKMLAELPWSSRYGL